MKESPEVVKFDSAGTPLPALSAPTPTPRGTKDTGSIMSQRSTNNESKLGNRKNQCVFAIVLSVLRERSGKEWLSPGTALLQNEGGDQLPSRPGRGSRGDGSTGDRGGGVAEARACGRPRPGDVPGGSASWCPAPRTRRRVTGRPDLRHPLRLAAAWGTSPCPPLPSPAPWRAGAPRCEEQPLHGQGQTRNPGFGSGCEAAAGI